MMGGLAYMTGPPGRPLRAGASVNDIMGGMFGAIGILAALREREPHRPGQLVQSALFENNVFLVAQHMAQYAVTGKPAAPMPERHLAPGRSTTCSTTSDGEQVFVGVVSDTQWRAFCDAFGLRDLLADPRSRATRSASRRAKRFMPMLRAVREFTRAEIWRSARQARPALRADHEARGAVRRSAPEVSGRDVDVTLPDGRTTPVPALPLEMKGHRFGRRLDVPRAGEHSASIAEELGYGPDDIERLAGAGILGLDRTAAPPTQPVGRAPAVRRRDGLQTAYRLSKRT